MLAGRLCRDAEVRHTKGGQIVANFSLGTQESYKDRFGRVAKKTAWHRVQVWGDLAETVSANLRQGARVYVEGKLIIRNWIDKQNQKRRSTEVVASDVRSLRWLQAMGRKAGANSPTSIPAIAMTENLGLSRACSRASPSFLRLIS